MLMNIAKLNLASEAPPEINIPVVRKASGDEGMERLVASIRQHGVILPLVVVTHKLGNFVIAGNRRLIACRKIAEETGDEIAVEVIEDRDTAGDRREIALATNVALPPHPIDVYEVVTTLVEDGMTPADAQARFALTPKRYAQIMRLGSLSQTIRDAWRNEEMSGEAAQAFALTDDHAVQDKLYKSMKRSGNIQPHSVRHQLTYHQRDLGPRLEFVGIDAFRTAGGKVNEDLFGTSHTVAGKADEKLLAKMVADKLEAEKQKLIADGWSWVEMRDDVQSSYMYGSVQPTRGKFSAEQKAKAGCFLSFDHDGKLKVDLGRLKPEDRRKVEAAEKRKAGGSKEEQAPKPIVSAQLLHRLSLAFEQGLAAAMENTPRTAVAMLIANLATGVGPLDVRAKGGHEDAEFSSLVDQILSHTDAELIVMLSKVAARAVNVSSMTKAPAGREDVKAIAPRLLDLRERVWEAFDQRDYFSSIRVGAIADVVSATVGKEQGALVAKMMKGKAVDFAVDNVPRWLPPEIDPSPEAAEKRAAPKRVASKKATAKKSAKKQVAKKKAKR